MKRNIIIIIVIIIIIIIIIIYKKWTVHVYWISSILIGSTELGYQLLYLLCPNMVNEH